MRRFTKDELDRLKEAEPYFYTCINAGYKRATKLRTDKMVADIWDSVADTPTPRNFACGQCSYKLYLKVGKKYYEDLDAVSKELEPNSVSDSLPDTSINTDNNKATDKEQLCQTKTTEHRTKGLKPGRRPNRQTK